MKGCDKVDKKKKVKKR